ncbi:MAG: hypothetical protein IPK13_24375 [Deltaproteobacteria bacterium]|nr:hypothetical protein [Deltaproteobacteria bacterium]
MRCLGPCLALVVSAWAWSGESSSLWAATPDAASHLLKGAELFRDGAFESAVVEFQVAERLDAATSEASWYLAASLTQVGRFEEAVAVFSRAARLSPVYRDVLLDYYFAVACAETGLSLMAEGLLAGVEARGGPKIRAQASALRIALLRRERERPWSDARVLKTIERGTSARRARDLDYARLCFLEALAGARLVRSDALEKRTTNEILSLEQALKASEEAPDQKTAPKANNPAAKANNAAAKANNAAAKANNAAAKANGRPAADTGAAVNAGAAADTGAAADPGGAADTGATADAGDSAR